MALDLVYPRPSVEGDALPFFAEPTRQEAISYAVFCLKKKKKKKKKTTSHKQIKPIKQKTQSHDYTVPSRICSP